MKSWPLPLVLASLVAGCAPPAGRSGNHDGGTGGNGGGAGTGGNGGSGSGGNGGNAGGGGDAGVGPDRIVDWDGGATCGMATTAIPYSPKTPDVLIAFDHSGSMGKAFGTGTRLSVEQMILRELVMQYQDKVRWGYEEFPVNTSAMACRAGADSACCGSPVTVPPDFLNYPKIDTAMKPCGGAGSCSDSRSGTPTPDALRVCREFYSGFVDGIKERYVLLSTDGDPTCVPAGLPGGDPCTGSEEQVKMLAAAGVKTIVLGVSDEVASSACLNRLAQAGGVPRAGGPPDFYPGSDPTLLRMYMEQIITGIAKPSCTVDLTEAPPDPMRIAVYFDGAQVPWDPTHMNGWDYEAGSTTKIIIYGSYCMNLEGFKVKAIDVRFGCPPCGGTVSCP